MNRLLIFKTFALSLLIVGTVLGMGARATAHAEETASFAIASGTHTAEGVFPVTVYEDSGNADVSIIVLDLQYDATKLELVEVGSAPAGLMNFPTQPELKQGAALITRVNSSFGGMQGKQTFAVLKFRALVNTGTTALTIGPRSEVYSMQTAENIWDGNTLGATIAFAPASSTTVASNSEHAVSAQRAGSPSQSKVPKKQAITAQPTNTNLHEVQDAATSGPVTVSIIGSSSPSSNHIAIAAVSIIAVCLAILSGYSMLIARKQGHHVGHHRHHAKRYHKVSHKKLRRKHA